MKIVFVLKATDPSENCPHCGTPLEQGDDGNCNRCGKPWAMSKGTAPVYFTAESLRAYAEHIKNRVSKAIDKRDKGSTVGMDFDAPAVAHSPESSVSYNESSDFEKSVAQTIAKMRQTISDARAKTKTDVSRDMKEAGNYRKGVVRLHGFRIAIENPKGSYRRGVDPAGNHWAIKMKNDYGYFLRRHGDDKTPMGIDGDPVDVFLGPHPESELVFIVDQVNRDGKFDEHKCVLGARSEEEAREVYLSNYQKGWNCGKITAFTLSQFRHWLSNVPKKTPASQLHIEKR